MEAIQGLEQIKVVSRARGCGDRLVRRVGTASAPCKSAVSCIEIEVYILNGSIVSLVTGGDYVALGDICKSEDRYYMLYELKRIMIRTVGRTCLVAGGNNEVVVSVNNVAPGVQDSYQRFDIGISMFEST